MKWYRELSLQRQFILYAIVGILINSVMSVFMNSWITDEDYSGLPKSGFKDRLIALFYYNVNIFAKIGSDEIFPISNRARLFISLYVILITAGLITIIHSMFFKLES